MGRRENLNALIRENKNVSALVQLSGNFIYDFDIIVDYLARHAGEIQMKLSCIVENNL